MLYMGYFMLSDRVLKRLSNLAWVNIACNNYVYISEHKYT